MTLSISIKRRINSVIMLSFTFSYCYAECHYAYRLNAKCRYAECHGAILTIILGSILECQTANNKFLSNVLG